MAVYWMNELRQRHPETYRHCMRVAWLADKLSDRLSISQEEKQWLIRGCFLHDVGKLLIAPEILNSTERLTQEQWTLMKEHPEMGARLLKDDSLPRYVLDIVRYHHERWDGGGYPRGLKNQVIPFGARVCCVLDAFDSMVTDRPYRKGRTTDEAIAELYAHTGTQFCKEIVDQFAALRDELQFR